MADLEQYITLSVLFSLNCLPLNTLPPAMLFRQTFSMHVDCCFDFHESAEKQEKQEKHRNEEKDSKHQRHPVQLSVSERAYLQVCATMLYSFTSRIVNLMKSLATFTHRQL